MKLILLLASTLVTSVVYFYMPDRSMDLSTINRAPTATSPTVEVPQPPSTDQKIQVALLLDTSNSMDGLINQAKSRLWNIVNTLTTLKYNGQEPTIEIALYEYGNDRLSEKGNYIRQVTPLTQDLDALSEKLFSLTTNGGSEYCGAVIGEAVSRLEWNNHDKDMKLIFIAGNESFNQGPIAYKNTIQHANQKNIYVNTILCGRGGDEVGWKNGADIGKGKFFMLDSDNSITYIETPYDDLIDECNTKLNATYLGYGVEGSDKKTRQEKEDNNAYSMSKSNKIERAVSKSKINYKNEDWDIVDAYQNDKDILTKVNSNQLPKEMKNKSIPENTKFIQEKISERAKIQKDIASLSIKRDEYIKIESNKNNKNESDDINNAFNSAIFNLAHSIGYETK